MNKEKSSSITILESGSAFYGNPPYQVMAALKILTGWPEKPSEEAKRTAIKTIREWEASVLKRRTETLEAKVKPEK